LSSFNLNLLLRAQNLQLTTERPLRGRLAYRDEEIVWEDPSGPLKISRVTANRDYCLRHGDEIAVDVSPENRLCVRALADIPQITIDHFLADQVVPRVLSRQSELVVHAGAVRQGGTAVLLLGASGHGKSTLSASLSHAGWELLGDDAMVVSWEDGVPSANAIYPGLRLFPDSLEAVVSSGVTAHSMAHYSSKRRVDAAVAQPHRADPSAIAAMFLLGGPGEIDTVRMRCLSIADSCIAVLENSFALNPTDTGCARRRLQSAARLATEVSAFRIEFPRDYQRLPDVRKAIEQQVAVICLAKAP
jgi:hypothetical protein